MSSSDVDAIGSDIVAIQRAARFADTSLEEWAARLVLLINAQPDHSGAAIDNVRQVGTAAGGSNGTLLFDAQWSEAGTLHSKSLVLRFLPASGLFHHYNIEEQFLLQRALEPTAVPVPPQVWVDASGAYLVRPGYVMEQVAGQSTPMTWMTSGIIADASPVERRCMIENYLTALAELHALDWNELEVGWLLKRAEGDRPIERETNWYWDALIWADNPKYEAMLSPIRNWLIENDPDEAEIVICHGDANLGNYMFEGTRVSAVVDWEMSFLGTPECDLSFLMMGDQILQADVEPLEGVPDYEERKRIYERISGRTLKNLPYYELFTAYRMAVINVLAMKHFPTEILTSFMPVLERGPALAVKMAGNLMVK